VLWSLSTLKGFGHIDNVQLGDLIPGNGMLEVFYAPEAGREAVMIGWDGKKAV